MSPDIPVVAALANPVRNPNETRLV